MKNTLKTKGFLFHAELTNPFPETSTGLDFRWISRDLATHLPPVLTKKTGAAAQNVAFYIWTNHRLNVLVEVDSF